jgi:hypothetical protein
MTTMEEFKAKCKDYDDGKLDYHEIIELFKVIEREGLFIILPEEYFKVYNFLCAKGLI